MGNKNFFKKLFLNHLTNGEKDSIIDKLNKARPVGQAVKTLASHAENMGSIPVRVTNDRKQDRSPAFSFLSLVTRTLIKPSDVRRWVRICRSEIGKLVCQAKSEQIFAPAKFPYSTLQYFGSPTKKKQAFRSGCLFLFVCAPHKTEPTCAMSVRANLQKISDAQGVRIPRREALEVLQ